MLMKMAAVLTVSVLLLCCCSVSSADPSQCDSYAKKGRTAAVPMTIPLDQSDQLTWKKDGSTIFRRKGKVFGPGVKDDVTGDGSLWLINVSQSNNGAYTAAVHGADGRSKGTSKTTRLCVLDPVPKPTVTQSECDETPNVNFKCVVPPQAKGYGFAWLQKNEVLPGETGQSLTRPIDQVKSDPIACNISNHISWETSEDVQQTCYNPVPKPTVTQSECDETPNVNFKCVVQPQAEGYGFAWLQKNEVLPGEKGQTLTRPINQVKSDPIACNISNHVSWETSEDVQQTCYKSFFTDKLLGINTWIFVAAGGGVVLLLIIVVIVCCCCSKRRKRLRLEEEGELRLAWTNEKPQHHSCQHQHRQNLDPQRQQQQPAGHTGPRQQRSRQKAPGAPDQPRPRPRRPEQAPRPPGQSDEEQPPPLPQPRKKVPAARRV